jgi:NYN domain
LPFVQTGNAVSETFSNLGETTRVGGLVAILVDGENIPHGALSVIEAAAKDLGRIVIRRVYGDMTTRRDWDSEPRYHSIHTGHRAGKNGADIRLAVDAVDLAHRGYATAFVIASSDSDFTHLAIWMRETDLPVVGVGLTHAAQSFRQVCTAFHLFAPTPAAPVPARPKPHQNLSPVDERLHRAIRNSTTTNGISLVTLGNLMKGETVKAQTQMATWRQYLASKTELYTLSRKGAETSVALVNP